MNGFYIEETYLFNTKVNRIGVKNDAKTSLKALLAQRATDASCIDTLSGQD